ncbi:hypothetical protein [Microcoleus asticus]|uniref:Uncharacterized protein n=1 Tax=Microcoleus asticus IPMA8 TaxID=2563858 RepID=A0ABX2D1D5_9CYAN|nr:hypothetical protein [Microcoleus asticus]NQE35973.1 hypothetical protein [Microcoleus asticus IPMA8]
MRELIRYAKTPRYPCNTQSPQLGFNELDVQFSRSKLGNERIASVHTALERSEAAGLYYGSERKILKQAVLEFLVHGLRYVFYAQPGPLSRGLPTAHSAEPLKSKLVALPSEVYVWPDPQGAVRGQAIAPLYRSVPQAAKNDSKLYALLSLIDAIRVGRVREQRDGR